MEGPSKVLSEVRDTDTQILILSRIEEYLANGMPNLIELYVTCKVQDIFNTPYYNGCI